MQVHKALVLDTFTAVACLGVNIDPNGVEVCCTSNPNSKRQSKDVDTLRNFVSKNFQRGSSSICEIEYCLNEVLKDIIQGLPRERPSVLDKIAARALSSHRHQISIYILTSGRWDDSPGGTSGANHSIFKLIEELQRRKIDRTRVSFHFISFGDDPVGLDRLRILDDDMGPL